MSPDVWLSIAIQIPVVLLFCVFMGYIVKMFLSHINEVETRSQKFMETQREANNDATKSLATTNAQAVKDLAIMNAQAVKELAAEHRAIMERLTDSMCKEMDGLGLMLSEIKSGNIGHDTYVRTAFKERFGPAVISTAEQAAAVAEAQAQHQTSRR